MKYDVLLYSMANEAGMEGIPVRKLICDCCGKEIDESYKSDGLGLKPKAHLTVFGEDNGLDWVNLEYDLCQFCTRRIMDVTKMGFISSSEDS